jgi:hypothetical protein
MPLSFTTAQKLDDIRKIINKTENNSPYIQKALGQELGEVIGSNDIKLELQNIREQFRESEEPFFMHMVIEANNNLEKHNANVLVSEIGKEIVKTGTKFTVVSPTGIVLGDAINFGANKVHESLVASSMNAVQTDLKYRLKQYESRNQEEFNGLIASFNPRSPDAFLAKLNNASLVIGDDYLGNLSETQRKIADSFYQRHATTILSNGIESLILGNAASLTEIESLRTDIGQLSEVFVTGMKHTQEQLSSIIGVQESIYEDLTDLKKDTKKNFAFVFDFMYSRMNPSERRAAIENGMISLNAEDRSAELKKIDVLERQERLQTTMSEMLNSGAQILQIARNLNINNSILETATKAYQIGSIVSSAAQSYLSVPPNYLGAMASISNIFGLGGPDPAAQKHQAIMQSFDKVFMRLDQMDEKLEALLQSQEKILEGQKILYEQMVNIQNEIVKTHQEEMDYLKRIQGDILVNRNLIVRERSEDYTGCEFFSNVFLNNITPSIVDIDRGIIPSISEFRNWLNIRNKQHCESCHKALETIFDVEDRDNLRFQFKTLSYKEIDTEAITVLNDTIYELSLYFLNNEVHNFLGFTKEQRNTSTYYTIDNLSLWEQKFEILEDPTTDVTSRTVKTSLLEPNIVMMHTRYLLNFHIFYLYMKTLDTPLTYEEQVNSGNVDNSGKNMLAENLQLLNFTIAQQNLLQGDILVPIYIFFNPGGLSKGNFSARTKFYPGRKLFKLYLQKRTDK